MSAQLSIFDPPLRFPRARRSDPLSSLEAADAIEASGAANAQARAALAAVHRWPNSTSMELARAAGMDRYALARRLPELAAAGLVEKVCPGPATVACAVSGKRVVRWRPK